MARNPDRNFPDRETGIFIEREILTPHPILIDQKISTLQPIALNTGFTRLVEYFDPTGGEWREHFREEYGQWDTNVWIIYFDWFDGDHLLIQKNDYVSWNRDLMFLNQAYDPNRDDRIKVVIKNIERWAGLSGQEQNGVDCGMVEAICVEC
jgi:hypothetical protein